MFKLQMGKTGINEAVKNENGSDLVGGYTESPIIECERCESRDSNIEIHEKYGICMRCVKEVEDEQKEITELVSKGHQEHCACRIVWGDGECECGIINDDIHRKQAIKAVEKVESISNENKSALKFISRYCNCYKCRLHPMECKECSFDARQMIYSYNIGFEAGLKSKS